MKVTFELDNGATVTIHGDGARDIANFACVDERNYLQGEVVDITAQPEPKEDGNGPK